VQPVDFTTLTATCSELRAQWLPARLEQVYQRDRFTVQPVDFTTLTAACSELRAQWLPARLEQVYQRDRFTVSIEIDSSIALRIPCNL